MQNNDFPKIAAASKNSDGWGGSSNRTQLTFESIQSCIDKVKDWLKDPDETAWRIIDGDNLRAWVSSGEWVELTIKSARVNMGVEIPIENVTIGFPNF